MSTRKARARARVPSALCAAIALVTLAAPCLAQERARWAGPRLFDLDASVALRAQDPRASALAERSSWLVVGLVMAAPLGESARAAALSNAGALPWSEAALSIVAPYAATALVGLGAKYLFARERPFATRAGLSSRCGARGRRDGPECEWDRNGSFPSLHSAMGFVGAGTLCVHAARFVPAGPWDAAACGLGMLGATVGAALRIVADRHYATDVLAGGALGLTLAVGLGAGLHGGAGPLPLGRALEAPAGSSLAPAILGGVAGVLGGALLSAALARAW